MIEQLLIHLLFGLAVGCTMSYFLVMRGQQHLVMLARGLYGALAGVLLLVAVGLMIHIVNHKFEFAYVYGYSSKELQTPFLYASFYSGQEGSFLLWTILTVFLGLTLIPYIRKRNYEGEVMFFYSLIVCFLSVMLVAKNPFAFLWENMAKDGVTQTQVNNLIAQSSLNGKGLNPILQNVWIMIHPPILFTGFAAMSVPFVFAMAGLLKRDYQAWIKVAFPWALSACAILGFGIMLGGFWAYETLGWGGFWAWDPVENSSLIPWLFCVALVHSMMVQRKNKGLVKTNLVLATLSFVAVLYSTFLTRSGILGETSVHSFVEPGYFVYLMLLVFLLSFLVIGIALIIYRAKDIAKLNESFNFSSREFALSIGSAIVLASATIVTLGTSAPIFQELMKMNKKAIEASFYDSMHIPIMAVLFLVNAVSLAMSWKHTKTEVIAKRLMPSLIVAAIATILTYFFGVHNAIWLILVFFSWFALAMNTEMAWRILRKSPSMTGAYVSHTGVALLMLGIIATAGYSVKEHAVLPQGQSVDVLGYKLTYQNKEQVEKDLKDRDKFKFHISVEKEGKSQSIAPVLYYSDFNKRQSPFLEPGIAWTLGKDLYVAPQALDHTGTHTLMKEEEDAMAFDSTLKLKMLKFDMSEAQQSDIPGSMKMAAVIQVTHGKDTVTDKVYTYFSNNNFIPKEYRLPNSSVVINLVSVERNQEKPELSTASFSVFDSAKPETYPREAFVAEISVKPLINLVWIGVITMVAGFIVSIIRYSLEERRNKRQSAKAAQPIAAEEGLSVEATS